MIKILRVAAFVLVVCVVLGLMNGTLRTQGAGDSFRKAPKNTITTTAEKVDKDGYVITRDQKKDTHEGSTTTTTPWGTIADEGVIYRFNAPAGVARKDDTIYKVELYGIKEHATATNEMTSAVVSLDDFTQSWSTSMFAGYLPGILVSDGGKAVPMEVQRPFYTPEEKTMEFTAGKLENVPDQLKNLPNLTLQDHPTEAFSKASLYILVPISKTIKDCPLIPYTHCESAVLFNENLVGMDLHNSIFTGANMAQMTARNINISGSQLSRADLFRTDAGGINANNIYAPWLNAYQLAAPGGTFKDANLTDSKLFRSNFREADLSGSQLIRADLSGIDGTNARFTRSMANGAQFPRANLAGADMSNMDLSGANLSYADLTGTNFSNSNLSGATLYNATTRNTSFVGATFSQTTCVNGKVLNRC